mgnify:CR=1 FL=1
MSICGIRSRDSGFGIHKLLQELLGFGIRDSQTFYMSFLGFGIRDSQTFTTPVWDSFGIRFGIRKTFTTPFWYSLGFGIRDSQFFTTPVWDSFWYSLNFYKFRWPITYGIDNPVWHKKARSPPNFSPILTLLEAYFSGKWLFRHPRTVKSGVFHLRIPPPIRIPPLVIPKSETRGGVFLGGKKSIFPAPFWLYLHVMNIPFICAIDRHRPSTGDGGRWHPCIHEINTDICFILLEKHVNMKIKQNWTVLNYTSVQFHTFSYYFFTSNMYVWMWYMDRYMDANGRCIARWWCIARRTVDVKRYALQIHTPLQNLCTVSILQ